MTIELTEEQKIKILNTDDLYTVLQDILLREEIIDREKEHFWMIGLATNFRLLYIELVSMGSVNATIVEPMNVYRIAVMKGATGIIMAHNHPSGEIQPSETDKDLTDRLIQVGRILNIRAMDHMVISTRTYYSFAETGLLATLEKSTKWVPQYELIKRIRAEEKKIQEEAVKVAAKKNLEKGLKQGKNEGLKEGEIRGIEKEKIEIAKGMKKKGYSIKDIIDLTGLTKEEIEKIK